MAASCLVDQFVGTFGDRSGPRSRNGCQTCRKKKVKCDEVRPECQRCQRLSRVCEWEPSSTRKMKKGRKRAAPRSTTSTRIPSPPSPPLEEMVRISRPRRTPTAEIADEPSHQLLLSPKSPSALRSTSLPPSSSLRWSQFLGGTLPCGLDFGPQEQKAIHSYQTRFTSSVDTKNPLYSVPAIILRNGAVSEMTMHMVLAVGLQTFAMEARQNAKTRGGGSHSLLATSHYCQALRILGESTASSTFGISDLDFVLASLWMMVMYEQRFGDTPEQAISAHLHGVWSVLDVHFGWSRASTLDLAERESSLQQNSFSDKIQQLSYLGARLIIWLVGFDARAASFGLGGFLNTTLARSLGSEQVHMTDERWSNSLSAMYEKSAPLFQVTWGAEYPTTEILYDIEHSTVFELYRECSQLRRMVAELAHLSVEEQAARSLEVERKMKSMEYQYMDVFSIAARIPLSPDGGSKELAMTICWVVPHFQACVLDFNRLIRTNNSVGQRELAAVQSIINLSAYGRQVGGAAAMLRIAWPLFITGLETESPVYHTWVLDCLKELEEFGKGYGLAVQLLREAIANKSYRREDTERVFII